VLLFRYFGLQKRDFLGVEGEVRVAAVLLEQLDRINEMESLMDQQQHEMKGEDLRGGGVCPTASPQPKTVDTLNRQGSD
jgi:hypothetical protein